MIVQRLMCRKKRIRGIRLLTLRLDLTEA